MPQYISRAPWNLPFRPAPTVIAPNIIAPANWCICQIFVESPGHSGSLIVNDAASLQGANSGNEILAMTFDQLTAGQMIPVSYDTTLGGVISSVPVGGIFSVYTFPAQTDAPWTDPPFSGPLVFAA
jgi:hypothetical protein